MLTIKEQNDVAIENGIAPTMNGFCDANLPERQIHAFAAALLARIIRGGTMALPSPITASQQAAS